MRDILYKIMRHNNGKNIRKILKEYIQGLKEWGMYIVPERWLKVVG